MKITSKNFLNNQVLPLKYTCDGENISPELSWSDFPEGTKSFALTMIDPDSPSGNFIHWMAANIPLETTGIEEGSSNINGENLNNDFGESGYGGPCPGVGKHRYVFTIYAIKTASISEITKENFFEKIKPLIIDKAELVGEYERNTNG